MSNIVVKNLMFSYENSEDIIFNNVSININTNWHLGFCGRNGRGKTTFLRLLMGELEYSDSITHNIDFEYFPFKVNNPKCLVIDILLEIIPNIEIWQIQKELNLLDMDSDDVLYRTFDTLSNGEQTKILLAVLFLKDGKFPLIDEPTNHLDILGRQTVANYLKSKKGFILVSHDRIFLDRCIDHVLSINRNDIEIIKGNFSVWLEQKQMRDAFELNQNEKLTKEIDRLEGAKRKAKDWADKAEGAKIGIDPYKVDNKMGHRTNQSSKSKAMMGRAKAIGNRIDRDIEIKSGLLKNIESSFELKLQSLKHASDHILSLSDISVNYGSENIVTDFNLVVNHGERVAIRGANGSGKSSLIKLICRENIPHKGKINVSPKLIMSYVGQDASFLKGSLGDFAIKNNLDATLFFAVLNKLDFYGRQFNKDMSEFSAGQKKKVLIAGSLAKAAHIYIWDEPLNYIDVLSRIQIEDVIMEYKPTMVFIEHDRAFVEKVATRVVDL